MRLSAYRTAFVAILAAFTIAVELPNLYLYVQPMYGDFGFSVLNDTAHAVQPHAAAAGIRAGDRIVFSAMPAEDRYNPPWRFAPIGRTVTFHFLRGATPFTRTLTAHYNAHEWSVRNLWATIAKKTAVLILIVFAGALFLTRPTLLSGALFIMAIGWSLAIPMFYSFLPIQPYLWLSGICDFIRMCSPMAFLAVALLVSAAKPPTATQRLGAVFIPIALFWAVAGVNNAVKSVGVYNEALIGLLFTPGKACIFSGMALLLATAFRRSAPAGVRIAAFCLTVAGMSRMFVGPALLLLPEWMQGVTESISDSSGAITVIATLVVVYVVIRERVVDTGLVMSRILSYAAVLAGIIALLGVVDWAFASQLAVHPLALPAEIVAAVFVGYRFSGFRDVAHSLSLAAIDAPAAAAQGRVRDERDALVRALGLAERTRQSGLIAEIRARCAFSAWFYGDDEAFERHIAALRNTLGSRTMRGLAALTGAEDFDASTLAEWKARALLVAYGNANDATIAQRYAHEACVAADESGLPWLRILARLALAEISPGERTQILTATIEIAKDAGWLPLTKSLLALRSDARDIGLLEPFVNARLRKIRAEQPTVEISFFNGDVRVFGAPVQLHEKERALLFTVALAETAINTDELIDSLWPEADGDAARTAFRACLYRLRKQSGNDRIVHRAGKGYRLCAGADVDLWNVQHALDATRRDELKQLYEAFVSGQERRAMLGPWFDPFERMLTRRMQDVKRMLDHAQPVKALSIILFASFLLAHSSAALAGTTGGIVGYVTDSGGAPLGSVSITASAPSHLEATTSDANGHFAFLSLPPDRYRIVATHADYDAPVASVTVLADQVQPVTLTMTRARRLIASVRSQAGSLVKPSVGGDVYDVEPAQIEKSIALGGGGNLESAYSAIASVPGVVVPIGGAGWNQPVFIRGAAAWTTAYEYDGVPVNRSFDNAPATTASSLGSQELQVYTGGGPSSVAASGTSGFINQVIKTGTYPGYALFGGGIATDAFYHSARAEGGGATANRSFSYYAGLSGYDQDYRYGDSQNLYSGVLTNVNNIGVYNVCPPQGFAGPVPVQGCIAQAFGLYGFLSAVTDRENVVNLHFGFARRNGLRDDVQLLWSASAMRHLWNSAPDQSDLNQYMIAATAFPYSATTNYPFYMDALTYNVPFGTSISGVAPQIYFQPNSPSARAPFSPQPLNANDLSNNDTGVFKAQLTREFGSRSFLRFMGYSLFSDWNRDEPQSAFSAFPAGPPNYGLITHTSGGTLQYVDQLNARHLLQLSANYTHASMVRFNSSGYLSLSFSNLFGCPIPVFGFACAKASPIGYLSLDSSGAYHCWNPVNGAEVLCLNVYNDTLGLRPYGAAIAAANGLTPTPANGALFFQSPTRAGGSNAFIGPFATAPAGSPAAQAGAQWVSLWDGNASGPLNTVNPNFYSFSLGDQWRPNDKLTVNASIRYDRYDFGLTPATTPINRFYAQLINQFLCFNPVAYAPARAKIAPGVLPSGQPILKALCPQGFFHPGNGGVPPFSLDFPHVYGMNFWEPRLSATYAQNADTVWRISAGRYAQPPISASVEYLFRGASVVAWSNSTQLGFWSPFHPIPGQTAAQYDMSFEKRVHGTPLTFKISPFYGVTSNWQQNAFIGGNFVTQIPVGRARNWGAEAQLNYGDFTRQGFSALLSFTFTQSQVQFQGLLAPNQIHAVNAAIDNYNAITAGPRCYDSSLVAPNGFNAPDPTCSDPAHDILNPYAGLPRQAHLDENGWYQPGVLALVPPASTDALFYNSPFVTNLIVNWRRNRLAVTPSLQIQAGTYYGSPLHFTGVDPTACGANQGATLKCDYTTMTTVGGQPNVGYLYIPNLQTGQFPGIGQYRQPSIAMLNLQLSYDVSPKIALQATATDLWHTCFGGSVEPWTRANPPSRTVCAYTANPWYISNFYNGASPLDAAANGGITPYPWMLQSYIPAPATNVGGLGLYFPFNLYLQAQVKL